MGISSIFNQLAHLALDQIYPPVCTLCGITDGTFLCPSCLKSFRPLRRPADGVLPGLLAAYEYEGRVRQAVHALKYRRCTGLVEPLSALLASRIEIDYDLAVPVPIHWTRRAVRGFNQSELLCSDLPNEKVARWALSRTRMTRPQALLNEKERITNVLGAFTAKNRLEDLSVVLIDDVATTGSTLRVCREALLQAGAREVHTMVFAATM